MQCNNKFSIKSITLSALFTALIAIFSQISIPIGPVPINLAALAVFLVAALLDLEISWISVTVFVLLGAVGIPVFSGFSGGIGKLLGPTGGYIFGYILTVLVIGIAIKIFGKSKPTLIISMLCGLILLYLCGTLWFVFVSGGTQTFMGALSLCVLPFIPGDLIKIAVAVLLTHYLEKPLKKLEV